ncbi:MAG: antibiotic biosynthesis monooxygenase [Spirochaetes bacterium]|nr:antibiotic biosynthesis monooxygenase [Spirochaetota bacterium]
MHVTTVEVYVREENIEDFIQATLENFEDSIREPGNLRFDVLQSIDDPCRFTLYEAYESEEAAKAHKSTSHYLQWKERVAPMMAKPRVGIAHRVIAPVELKQWKP